MKIIILILILSLQGCAIHYQNEKGVKAKADDIQTSKGNIKDGKGHFWSTLDIWIPWRLKEATKNCE